MTVNTPVLTDVTLYAQWLPLSSCVSGGTKTTYNDGTYIWTIHTFTANGTFTNSCPGTNIPVEYIIAAGGGGGGTSG